MDNKNPPPRSKISIDDDSDEDRKPSFDDAKHSDSDDMSVAVPPAPQPFHSPSSLASGGPPSAANSTKRYRPAPAKTFQCRGYGECRMVFSRSEHLARHIRYAPFLPLRRLSSSIVVYLAFMPCDVRRISGDALEAFASELAVVDDALSPAVPAADDLPPGSTPANGRSLATAASSSRASTTSVSMRRRSMPTSRSRMTA